MRDGDRKTLKNITVYRTNCTKIEIFIHYLIEDLFSFND